MERPAELLRYRVHWRMAVRPAGGPTVGVIHGVTKELSVGDAVVLLESDPGSSSGVAIQLQIPPISRGQPYTMVANGRVESSICAARENGFRVNIHFTNLSATDKAKLASSLEQHQGGRPIAPPKQPIDTGPPETEKTDADSASEKGVSVIRDVFPWRLP